MDNTFYLTIATLAVTFFTGTALAIFAWLTYKLSKNISQKRFSPVLDLYPINPVEVGSFDQGGIRYHGVKWQICLSNSGDIPIWVDNINISMYVTRLYESTGDTLTGVGKLCDILDDAGMILEKRALGVAGNTQCTITVFMCHADKREEQHKLVQTGDSTLMQIEFLQRGGQGRPSGWLMAKSDKFQLPEKFGKESIAQLT